MRPAFTIADHSLLLWQTSHAIHVALVTPQASRPRLSGEGAPPLPLGAARTA